MSVDSLPLWVFFIGTILIVMASIEAGYRLGRSAHRHSEDEKESPISGVSGAILGLTAFMLVFTFGIVADRYDARKALVREDANAIRTSYARADFVPEPDRTESKHLLKKFLDLRLTLAGDPQHAETWLAETAQIQRRLWNVAVANAEKDMNSDVAALYIESLNDLAAMTATRTAVGLQARVPIGLWLVLCGLTVLGMVSIGYHTGIAGSKRTKATLNLALAFALVIIVIAALDRPITSGPVTQQPLVDLQGSLATER
jgi:hypothetical protein